MVKIRNSIDLPSKYGVLKIVSFDELRDGKEHVAITFNNWETDLIPNVRIHSECFTGDILGSTKCDCGGQLDSMLKFIQVNGGIILYLRQEGRGIGLYNKIDAYKLQQEGYDTVAANNILGFDDDLRNYHVAAQMLKAMSISIVKLHTNNPKKREGLENNGIKVVTNIPTSLHVTKENKEYLKTKVLKSGHLINLLELA